MASYRTPLGRARGMGSAKHGVGHFIGQRVSAIALVVLVLWGVSSVLGLAARPDYATAVQWMHAPINAIPTALFIAVATYHMQLGMRTIVEDYIHRSLTKHALIVASQLICWAAAAVGVFSILKVAFSGGAF
jgi:succinate dehydrogenase / fumarate reductase membrane anchor subunit